MSSNTNIIKDEQLMEDEKAKMIKEDPRIDQVFDYNSINNDHKKAIKEVLTILESFGQEMIAEVIKQRFGIVARPKYNLADSEFIKCCEKANIIPIVQGFLVENNTEYPVVFIQDDIRKLNDFIEKIRSGSY